MTDIINKIRDHKGQDFEILGYFFSEHSSICRTSLIKKKSSKTGMEGIGTTFRKNYNNANSFCYLPHGEYIKQFELNLKNYQRTHGRGNYFSLFEIDEIVELEERKDRERGDVAIYIRCLIYAYLDKLGVYVDDFIHVGFAEAQENRTLEKHVFWVRSFQMKGLNNILVSIDRRSRSFFFDSEFQRKEDYLIQTKTLDQMIPMLFPGFDDVNSKLFAEVLAIFFENLPDQTTNKIKKNSEFVIKALEKGRK